MTFKITSTAFGWKALSSILPQFREQATFEVTKEGISFKLLDASRNSYMNMEWSKDKFKEFFVDGESHKVQFYTNDVEKIMKRFSADDVITISSTPKNTLLFEKVGTKTSFDLRLVVESADSGFMDAPTKISMDQRFAIEIKVLEKMIADSEVFDAEEAKFQNIGGKLVFSGKSANGEATGELLQSFNKEIKDTSFAFEFLKPFISSIKSVAEPIIQAGIEERKPLLLDVEIKDVGIIHYLLAPKIETV